MWRALNSCWWLYLPTFLAYYMHVLLDDSSQCFSSFMKINLIPFKRGIFWRSLSPWHHCDVFMRLHCRMHDSLPTKPNYFHYQFFSLTLLFCFQCVGFVVMLLFIYVGTHAHLYKQIFCGWDFRCRRELCSSLSTIRQYRLDFIWELALFVIFAFHLLTSTLNSILLFWVYVKRLQRKWSFYFNDIYNL